ncbi:MAG TPA: hypothetical protein VF711_08460 [Acidimicrobiales bacterium]|jgi:hypothetical protein
MLASALRELPTLAELVECDANETHQGWECDTWALGPRAERALHAVYAELLTGHPTEDQDFEELKAVLAARGVHLDALLVEVERDEETVNQVTRADGCELAAAASVIALDDWPIETTHLPNVPKQSRAKSESGLDAVAAALDGSGPADRLGANEHLYIASVKHTVGKDVAGLRRRLIASVTAEWTMPYVARQLEVFFLHLTSVLPRVVASRVFFAMESDSLDWGRASLVLVGTVDAGARAAAEADRTNLSRVAGARRFRTIAIARIDEFHERIEP